MNIKERISFDEFYAIVEKVTGDCFGDGTYSPAVYDLSLRTALINAYSPDFELNSTDNNALYESVYSEKACEIIDEIKQKKQYYDIEIAIRNKINFRKEMLVSGGLSMSDIALSKLIDKITDMADKMSDNINVDFITDIATKLADKDITAESLMKALTDFKSNTEV